jgi:hypothetical protein
MGASTSWNPQDLFRLVMGLLFKNQFNGSPVMKEHSTKLHLIYPETHNVEKYILI